MALLHFAVLLDDIEKVGANLEFVTEDFEKPLWDG